MLLRAAAGAVAIGLLALGGLALASFRYSWTDFWPNAGQPFATTLAGLAAISAAAIALHNARSQLDEMRAQRSQDQKRYEEQREQDQSRWDDERKREQVKDLRARFTEAAGLLGDTNATIRRSGAYALAALANDWRAEGDQAEMMVCFEVLASYVTAENSFYSDEEYQLIAGEDGPVRATVVALLSRNAEHYTGDIMEVGRSKLLHSSDLRGVVFTATIKHADLCRSDLSQANFERAPNLCGIQLDRTKLVDASFKGADLDGAQLWRADLTCANLNGAALRGADLSGATLRGANLTDIVYDETTKWPEGFSPPPSAW